MIGQFFVMGPFSMMIPLMAVRFANILGQDGNPAIPWIVYGNVAIASSLGLHIMRRPLTAVRGDPGGRRDERRRISDG